MCTTVYETAAFVLDGRIGLKKNLIGQVKNIPLLEPLSRASSLDGVGLAARQSLQPWFGTSPAGMHHASHRHVPLLPVLFSSMSCRRGPPLLLVPRPNTLRLNSLSVARFYSVRTLTLLLHLIRDRRSSMSDIDGRQYDCTRYKLRD